jgi:hypothetical protein
MLRFLYDLKEFFWRGHGKDTSLNRYISQEILQISKKTINVFCD